MQRDGIVITNQVTPMLNEYRLTTACLSMCSVFDNQINFHTWDSDNYSSYITPFRLNSRKVNTQPYMIDMIDSSMYMDYRSISSLQKYMHLYMVYLQCYPEMMEIFGKFGTLNSVLWRQKCFKEEVIRLFEFDNMPSNVTNVQLPNGEMFTEKHLLNYDEIKEGEK